MESLRVVMMLPVGAPLGPLVAALAAPTSDDAAPVNAMTVIEAATALFVVAVTVIRVCAVGANAHQASAVPSCALERTARVHVRAPVVFVTPVTIVFGAQHGSGASVETNATSNVLAPIVKLGLVVVVTCVLRLRVTLAAIVSGRPLDTTRFT